MVPAENLLRNRPAPGILSATLVQTAMTALNGISGRLVLAVFVVLQCADGLMTFQAVTVFGAVAEGNPLLATWIVLVGAGPALLGAKLVACLCATILHWCGHHRILGALAMLYIVLAVGPWLHVLTVIAGEP